MPESPAKEWYSDGLRFTCTQCGNCCTGPPGYVWFTEEEAAAMAKRLNVSVEEFHKRYTKRVMGRRSLEEIRNAYGEYDCVFLVSDKQTGKRTCSIYDVRPQQCRTWPFWPENLRTKRDWVASSQRCPGMTAGIKSETGTLYTIEQIRIIRDSNT